MFVLQRSCCVSHACGLLCVQLVDVQIWFISDFFEPIVIIYFDSFGEIFLVLFLPQGYTMILKLLDISLASYYKNVCRRVRQHPG